MKVNMTVEEAIDFAKEWNRGATFYEGSQGWRVVCMVLAQEVERLREALANRTAEPVEFNDWPEYHNEGMGCGLEDRRITDRYEAAQYGWDEAIERVAGLGPFFITPPDTVLRSEMESQLQIMHENHVRIQQELISQLESELEQKVYDARADAWNEGYNLGQDDGYFAGWVDGRD